MSLGVSGCPGGVPQPRGSPGTAEGQPRDTEGQARDIEGQARDTEGQARDIEGQATRPSLEVDPGWITISNLLPGDLLHLLRKK